VSAALRRFALAGCSDSKKQRPGPRAHEVPQLELQRRDFRLNISLPRTAEIIVSKSKGIVLRIFQRNGLKLDKDLISSGLVQNVNVYGMAKSKEI